MSPRRAAPRPSRRPENPFHTLARERFQQGQEAKTEQTERELQALRFYNDDQWPKEIRASREAATIDGIDFPARSCLSINKVKEPVKQVLNQERQSDMGAEIVPADDFGDLADIDETEIQLREGLLRRIQRAPETSDAITWMFGRAVICGTGYMGVMTRYLKGKTFDQEPYVHRFYNQSSVTIDPAHEQPDGSDAEWCFVGTDMPWDQYEAEFGTVDGKPNDVCSMNDSDFRGLGEDKQDWFTTEGKTRMCRVVDYYYTERKTRKLAELEDGSAYWADELPDDVTPRQTRMVVEKTIKWAKIDGYQTLDKTDWPGPDIPIIKCLGEEIQPYDAERRSVGMVSVSAQDANMGGNAMISKMVDTIGYTPIPPLMMAGGQQAGYETLYKYMNTRPISVLLYNQTDDDDRQAPPPFRTPIQTEIGPIVTALQFFNESVLSVVGQPSPTLGEVDPSIKTARGLKQLLSQAQLGNSNYMDNLARSVRRMAVILNGLFYPLYGQKPGRLARIVNGEGEGETVLINAPAETQADPMSPQAPQKPQKSYVLTEHAHFNVAIKVVKNHETRRDQESSMLGELIAANPEFMAWFGDKYLKNSDIPDNKDLAERAKLMLAPPIQKYLADKASGQAPIPPEVQQQLAQAEQVVQQLTEQNEQYRKDAETEGVKQQAETQRAQMEAQYKLQCDELKAMSAEQLAQAKLEFEAWKEQFKAAQAKLLQDDEQRHELAIKAADAQQAEEDAEAQRQHDAQMGRQAAEAGELSGQAGHRRTLEQGDRSHAQNLEAQAAKPKPAKGEK